MAKNMFVNTTGLPIEKEMPSLIGMDFSNVGKEPLKLNIGKTISDFATKAQAVKEQVNATKLYNQLLDEKNKWMIENLSDPNAFSNKERRTEIAKSYNSLIERQKVMLLGAKGTVSANQYSELEQQFKQQTYNLLFNLQTKTNSAFVQETVETMGIEKNALIVKCANTSNYDDIIQYQQELGKCFDAEATLGIDNREQRIKTMFGIEQNYLQKVIQNDIINNTTDKSLAKLDIDGEPLVDSEGNYIIDTNKVLKKVTDTRKALLSEDAIKPVAKKISKIYGITESAAYDYIYNARNEYFKVRQSTMEQELSYKGALYDAKLREIEEKTDLKRAKTIEDGDTLIANKASIGEIMSTPGINYISNDKVIQDNDAISIYTNGQFNSLKDMYDNGYYTLSVHSDYVNDFKKSFDSINDEISYVNAQQDIMNLITNDPLRDNSTFFYLGKVTGLSPEVFKNLAGKGAISPENTKKYLIAMKTANYDMSNINVGSKRGSPFFNDKLLDSQLLKLIDDNRNEFLGDELGDYPQSSPQKKVADIISMYQSSGKNSPFRKKIEKAKSDLKLLNTVNANMRLYNPSLNEGTRLNKYYGEQIDSSIAALNYEKLVKAGKTTVGFPNRFDRDSNTKVYDANLSIQRKGYEENMITIQELVELNYFKDGYDVEYFAPAIINKINNGEYTKEQIYSFPYNIQINKDIDVAIKDFRKRNLK